MNMTSISKCSYNKDQCCRTLGMTVGPHAECNIYVHASSRGGLPEVKGGIGACQASSCKFNNELECQAAKVDVAIDEKHADCQTYQAR